MFLGVFHYVIWKLGGWVTNEDISDAIEKLRHEIKFSEYIFYINPPHLKSIPDIEHAHVVLK